MNPFSLFLLLAVVGAVVAMGFVVISECRDAELVTLPATVLDKQVVVRERTVTTTQPTGGCPVCPGKSGTVTITTVVQEETFFVTLSINEGSKVSVHRVEVSRELFQQLKSGDNVEVQFLRGKASGRLCSRLEIRLIPAA